MCPGVDKFAAVIPPGPETGPGSKDHFGKNGGLHLRPPKKQKMEPQDVSERVGQRSVCQSSFLNLPWQPCSVLVDIWDERQLPQQTICGSMVRLRQLGITGNGMEWVLGEVYSAGTVGFCRRCFGLFVKVDAWDSMDMQPEQLQAFREATGHGSSMGTWVHAAVSGTREDAAARATER